MSTKWKWTLPLSVAVGAGVLSLWWTQQRTAHLQYRLLAAAPETVAADPALLRFASAQARPLYATHCAGCHGPDMHGNPAIGAPDLTDAVWLYGTGSVYDIERTLLYGIRSGEDQSHNEADMPAFGLRAS